VPVSRPYIDALDLFLGVCRNLCRPPSILPISSQGGGFCKELGVAESESLGDDY
jgi:hypothetical protein